MQKIRSLEPKRLERWLSFVNNQVILNGKESLAERFAEIDIVQVRKAFAEAQKVTQKYPKRMADVFKIPHLPTRLLELPPKKAAIS
jgi:hypothetical protein